MAKSPARRTLRKVPPATVSNPTMRDTLASTGIIIRSASTVASPLARRFSSPMSFIDRRLALIAYSTRGVANSPLSVREARRPLPRRFSAIAEGFSSTKDSARSSKLLSDRSTRPFVFRRNASLFRLPSTVTRRSSRAADIWIFITGPRRAAVGPSNMRAMRVGPRTAKVPSRAVICKRASSLLARLASRRPFQASQLPVPSSWTRSGSVRPAIAAITPLPGASRSSFRSSLLSSGTASRTSAMRSPPARFLPEMVAASNVACARPSAICALPASEATRGSPLTGASATKRSIRTSPISIS